ncbi:MAG: hypothetical protein ACRDP5_06300 [Streptosporangiaceae bacterium]
MSDHHRPRPIKRGPALATTALATTALAVLGAAAVSGCGGSASPSQAAATQPTGTATAAAQVAFTSDQLKSALLAKVNGEKPAAAAESGDYGKLPDVQTSKQTMNGVKVSPARCAQATETGFNSAVFAHAPASVVTFRVGRDGVSEVLVSAVPGAAATALGTTLPAGCDHYSATVDGKTYRYTVRESPLSGLAQKARALNVRAAGYASVDVWSVVYQGTGFVGAVTMVGPDSSEAGVKTLAQEAYAHAATALQP